MARISSGSEHCLALLRAVETELKVPISVMRITLTGRGRSALGNVQTIDGQCHSIEISTVISMPETSKTGGDDKA